MHNSSTKLLLNFILTDSSELQEWRTWKVWRCPDDEETLSEAMKLAYTDDLNDRAYQMSGPLKSLWVDMVKAGLSEVEWDVVADVIEGLNDEG